MEKMLTGASPSKFIRDNNDCSIKSVRSGEITSICDLIENEIGKVDDAIDAITKSCAVILNSEIAESSGDSQSQAKSSTELGARLSYLLERISFTKLRLLKIDARIQL